MLGYFQEAFLFFFFRFIFYFCVHVSRCGDVYNTSNSCCSVFIVFCIILNAMLSCFLFFFFFETCALLCDFGLTKIQQMGMYYIWGSLSCPVLLCYLICHHEKVCCLPPQTPMRCDNKKNIKSLDHNQTQVTGTSCCFVTHNQWLIRPHGIKGAVCRILWELIMFSIVYNHLKPVFVTLE